MSGIVLSSAVRQNLLALQDTAASLATTQNDLSTGKKVNSALDNPTNFFTAAGLDNRASDISNLLDVISNGVQVLQAANTGITSVESLVSQAKSIANQALQTSIGYSSKASVTSAAITNNGVAVTAGDLRGVGTVVAAAITGTAATITTSSTTATSTTLLSALGITNGQQIQLGNSLAGTTTINFYTGTPPASGANIVNIDLASGTVQDFINAANAHPSDVTFALNGSGQIQSSVHDSALYGLEDSGSPTGALAALGVIGTGSPPQTTGTNSPNTYNTITTLAGTNPITSSTLISGLTSGIGSSDTLTVNGATISFGGSGNSTTFSSTGATLNAANATVQNVLDAIDAVTGGTASIGTGGNAGKITVTGGVGGALTLTGSALSKLGLSATTGNSASVTASGTGNTLSFAAVGSGAATTITFGDGTGGTVKTLDQLNSALAADNLSATLSSAGALTVTTTNDAASSTIATPTGTAVSASTGAFYSSSVTAPTADATSQSARATLVSQYNAILTQIDNTASDASYNGVNLLNGDQLQLTFNETGKSKLNITGVNFGSAGLGLSSLVSGTDFIDNNSTNTILTNLNTVSATLRSEASALGSNLSVVQTRQDFNTNLINVLQTGSANLTQADINLEAANSQALSTRQSLSVSALSLANQSQQSVLQLLR